VFERRKKVIEPTGPGPMNMGPVGGRPGALCIDDENICDY